MTEALLSTVQRVNECDELRQVTSRTVERFRAWYVEARRAKELDLDLRVQGMNCGQLASYDVAWRWWKIVYLQAYPLFELSSLH